MRGADVSEYVVRFSVWARVQHAAVIVLFAVLLTWLDKRA